MKHAIALSLSLALELLHGSLWAQQPFGPASPTEATILRELSAINVKVDSLAQRVAALETGKPPAPVVSPTPAPTVSAYQKMSDAWLRAVALNKPLVVWTGAKICPGCVAEIEKSGEWVNLVCEANTFDSGTWPPPNSISVLVPTGEGTGMFERATLTELQPDPSNPSGARHLWNIRQALRGAARVAARVVTAPLRILHVGGGKGGMTRGGRGGCSGRGWG